MRKKPPSSGDDDGDSYIIFRPWITIKGKRLYASSYGLKVWPIRVHRRST